MKVIIEEMCGNLIEVFGAAVIFALLSGFVVFIRNFSDTFISYFLG